MNEDITCAEEGSALPSWLMVTHVDTYLKTPALLTAIKAWLEIEESGHGDGGQLISWSHKAFVAWDNRSDSVCGLLTYGDKDAAGDIFVYIGYVEAGHRRQGVYTHLWKELLKRAKDRSARRIVGTTHADNTGMRRLSLKLGRRQTALVQYELDLQRSIFDKTPDAPKKSLEVES